MTAWVGAQYGVAAAGHDPVISLRISPTPAHVPTARLVAVAAARKLGAQLEALDDIKLAVSEACNRAIAAAIRCELTDAVELSISRQRTSAGEEQIVLVVRDYAPYRDTDTDAVSAWQQMATAVSTEVSEELANAPLLLTGMIDEIEIGPAPDGIGTLVRASWPVKLGPNAGP